MAKMTDPMDALRSFQKTYSAGILQVQRGDLYNSLVVHLDHPNGQPRFSYAKVEGRNVTAFAMLVLVEPLDGKACFHLGYAVPEKHRGKGLAKSTVQAAIAELQAGMSRSGVKSFIVETVVGTDNVSSQHVAAATLTDRPEEITDEFSGLPALHYTKLV